MLKKNNIIVFTVAILFIALAVFYISIEKYYFAALPFGIAMLLMALYSFDKMFYLIALLAPVSLQLRFFMTVENDLSLPIEPFLFGILLIVLFKFIFENKSFNRKLLTHPISIAIYVNFIWIVITSITSTMPLVSLKFALSRMWFITAFYIMTLHLFMNLKNMYRYFWMYIGSFVIVIVYTLIRQSTYGFFNKQAANFVVAPFLPDHTSYGAILALLIPFIFYFVFSKQFSGIKRSMSFLVGVLYIVALIFSYTRAAWIGILLSVGLLVLLLLKIKGRTLVVLSGVLLAVLLTFSSQIIMHLERNQQDSSDNLMEQVSSVTNIKTDASNLERINRWNCAIRMFQEKPIVGFGPGTYMFQYAPFQFSTEQTIISTNFGEVGNAHSEFLGPLAESGVLGALTYIIILVLTGISTFRVFQSDNSKEIRWLAMSLFLGLVSYYVHGFLNNFLDIDKFSLLFWGYTAAIVVIDVVYRSDKSKSISST
ncbi:MAG: O-antigen ligase family protein [Salinivirgaceae bacterium]|nr:O-antigen ligase family protein [Salinivirgaceae bacterium]MDD4745897.1 O-antigen ligase family protein [Salinivirgaceae bacterium]MDY0278962.1 O-antigen ligase family protein [Salinivirgaceae bacterium]